MLIRNMVASKYTLGLFNLSYFHCIFKLSGSKIRVGSISPGLTKTEIVTKTFPDDPEFCKQIFSSFPSLDPEDIADLIENLLQAPPNIQMQDLQVTHVLSGLKNNYSENKS